MRTNLRRAFEWFWKAACYGDAEATTYVGICFHDGAGVKQNLKKALNHYRLASKNDPYAQYCLGLCYRDGEGIKKNRRLALCWLKKAAANGEQDAKETLMKFSKK